MGVVPPIYHFLLLAFASYRLWRLLAEDEILERPRRYIVRLPQTWEEDDPLPSSYRNELALFITCPWCAGAWVTLLVYSGWMFAIGHFPHSASSVLVAGGIWFALSASVGIIRSKLDPPE